jgi:hypothetical protein
MSLGIQAESEYDDAMNSSSVSPTSIVRKWRLTLTLGIVIGLVAGYLLFKVAPAELVKKNSASSSVEFWGDHYIADNTRFYFPYSYIQGGLVLRERIRVDRRGGVEGADGTVTVDAFDWEMKPLWSFQEPGEQGSIHQPLDRLYKVTKGGCCMAPNKYTYFSLQNGKKLYWSYVDDLIEVVLPTLRYHPTGASYHSPVSRFVLYANDDLYGSTGTLQYGTDNKLIRQITIRTGGGNFVPKDGVTIIYNGKRYSNSPGYAIEPWRTSGGAGMDESSKALTDFVISLRFKDGTELNFPVVNDDINLKAMKIPGPFKIEAK